MGNFNEALSAATEAARRKHNSANTPQIARFKLVFIYKNGTYSSPYHSYDRHGKHIDERLGLVKLIELVRKRRGTFVVASIFASLEDTPRVLNEKGEQNKIYNLLVYKEINGKEPQYSSRLQFTEGKMLIKW